MNSASHQRKCKTTSNHNKSCIICGEEENLKFISKVYSDVGMSISYADMLVKCFYIQFLDKHHGEDNMMCDQCINSTVFCVDFRRRVETAHKKLYDFIRETYSKDVHRSKNVQSKILRRSTRQIQNRTMKYDTNNDSDCKMSDYFEYKISNDNSYAVSKHRKKEEAIEENRKVDAREEYCDENNDSLPFDDEDQKSDISVTSVEIARATGHHELIEKSKKKTTYKIPELNQSETKCPVCEKDFPDLYLLKNHYLEHYPTFICHVCGLSFTLHHIYQKHLRVHSTPMFSCDLCDRKYNTLIAMNKHKQIKHFGFKPFVCHKCDMRFTSRIMKKKHMMDVHSVKCRMFECPKCKKEFHKRTIMEIHLKRVHFNLREFKCTDCAQEFDTQGALKKHYSVKHEGAKPYICEFCQKRFGRSRTLAVHRKIHLNQRDHVCQVCGAAFVQGTSLKCHMQSHHRDLIY